MSDFRTYYQEQYPVVLEGTAQPAMAALTEKVSPWSCFLTLIVRVKDALHPRRLHIALNAVARFSFPPSRRDGRDVGARTQAALRRAHGHTVVQLSSANAISHTKVHRPLSHYLDTMATAVAGPARGNETFYLFGPAAELSPKLHGIIGAYERPPFAEADAAFSFGIGPAGSGVPFHVHGHGFSEVIHGAKVLYRECV